VATFLDSTEIRVMSNLMIDQNQNKIYAINAYPDSHEKSVVSPTTISHYIREYDYTSNSISSTGFFTLESEALFVGTKGWLNTDNNFILTSKSYVYTVPAPAEYNHKMGDYPITDAAFDTTLGFIYSLQKNVLYINDVDGYNLLARINLGKNFEHVISVDGKVFVMIKEMANTKIIGLSPRKH